MSPEIVESACPITGQYRVIDLGQAPAFDLCSHCFNVDEVEEIHDHYELCTPTGNSNRTLHRTRRDAGLLTFDQEDYSGYWEPCSALSKMDVEEFDAILEQIRRERA